jgi:pimeloyl-ACP methyl ester carboxylesterase
MPTLGRFRYLEALPPPETRARGALVLIHAFPLSARMWEPQLALAAEGWHVLAPELRGFDDEGRQPSVLSQHPAALTVDDYAADVIDLLDALHLQEAVIGGLSMGGYVSFAILRRAPRYVRALVLADTKALADSPEAADGRLRMLQLLADRGLSAVADDMVPKLLGRSTRAERPDVSDQVRTLILSNPPAAVASAIQALMTRPDSTPLLRTIRCPTLIVVGDEDGLTPPALSEDMHRAISGSQLTRVLGAGHLSSLEQPRAFNAALVQFLTHRV